MAAAATDKARSVTDTGASTLLEGVSERPCVASACVDVLHRARLRADLANNSPPLDNGVTW